MHWTTAASRPTGLLCCDHRVRHSQRLQPFQYYRPAVLWSPSTAFPATSTISVLQACCAVITEYGIPSDFNHFSTTGLLCCDHRVRHSQRLQPFQYYRLAVLWSPSTAFPATSTISVLQACCAVITEYGIPSDFNHFSTTGLLCCDHRVRHSQRLQPSQYYMPAVLWSPSTAFPATSTISVLHACCAVITEYGIPSDFNHFSTTGLLCCDHRVRHSQRLQPFQYYRPSVLWSPSMAFPATSTISVLQACCAVITEYGIPSDFNHFSTTCLLCCDHRVRHSQRLQPFQYYRPAVLWSPSTAFPATSTISVLHACCAVITEYGIPSDFNHFSTTGLLCCDHRVRHSQRLQPFQYYRPAVLWSPSTPFPATSTISVLQACCAVITEYGIPSDFNHFSTTCLLCCDHRVRHSQRLQPFQYYRPAVLWSPSTAFPATSTISVLQACGAVITEYGIPSDFNHFSTTGLLCCDHRVRHSQRLQPFQYYMPAALWSPSTAFPATSTISVLQACCAVITEYGIPSDFNHFSTTGLLCCDHRVRHSQRLQPFQYYMPAVLWSPSTAFPATSTISVLQACCAVITEYSIPSDFNHFSTTGLLCCDHRVRHSQRLQPFQYYRPAVLWSPSTAFPATSTISVLHACCAVITEYGIPSDFNHFSTTGLLCCDHRVRHSQRLCKKIDCVT